MFESGIGINPTGSLCKSRLSSLCQEKLDNSTEKTGQLFIRKLKTQDSGLLQRFPLALCTIFPLTHENRRPVEQPRARIP